MEFKQTALLKPYIERNTNYEINQKTKATKSKNKMPN